MDISHKILTKTQIPKILTTQYTVMILGFLLSAACVTLCTIGLSPIAAIIAIVLIAFVLIRPSIVTIIKIEKIKAIIINEEYRIVHEIMVAKKYADEADEDDDEIEKVTFKDDNGNIRVETKNAYDYGLYDLNTEFYTVYIGDEKEPFTILDEKEYSEVK